MADLIWFRINAGNWNGSPSADPSTATGGVDISSVTGPYLPFGGYNTGFFGGQTLTADFGASSFVNPVPTGGSAWDSGTTFNPFDSTSGLTLSPDKLSIITGGSQTGYVSRATTDSATQTGLRYFEFTAVQSPQDWFTGVANAGAALSISGSGSTGYIQIAETGQVRVEFTVEATLGTIVAGDVIGMAISTPAPGSSNPQPLIMVI